MDQGMASLIWMLLLMIAPAAAQDRPVDPRTAIVQGTWLPLVSERGERVKSALVKREKGDVVRVYVAEADCAARLPRAYFFNNGKRVELEQVDFEATFVAICRGAR